jgi:hypothetical protein
MFQQIGPSPCRQPGKLDDVNQHYHHRQRRTRMAIMSRELFSQTHSTIASLFTQITAAHGETTSFSLDLGEDKDAEDMLNAIRAATSLASRNYVPQPTNLSQQRHAAIIEGHVDSSNLRDIITGELHIFAAFLLEGTASVRLRLGTLLCVYYARLGFKNHAYVMMSLLHRVGCLVRFGATSRKGVTLDGGMALFPEDLASHWDDVLAIVVEIRSRFAEPSSVTAVNCFAEPLGRRGSVDGPKSSEADRVRQDYALPWPRKHDPVSTAIDPLSGDLTPTLRLRESCDKKAASLDVASGYEHYFHQA